MFTQCAFCGARDKADRKTEEFIEKNKLEYKKKNKCFKICRSCMNIFKFNSEE